MEVTESTKANGVPLETPTLRASWPWATGSVIFAVDACPIPDAGRLPQPYCIRNLLLITDAYPSKSCGGIALFICCSICWLSFKRCCS